MSAHDNHGGGHDHGHHDEDDHGLHFSAKDYRTGFILAVILTVIPFALVMGKMLDNPAVAAFIILGLGAAQMVVHMVYFLHMNRQSQGGWIFMAAIFTIIILAIAIAGSLWVMFHMNANMMPATDHLMMRIRP